MMTKVPWKYGKKSFGNAASCLSFACILATVGTVFAADPSELLSAANGETLTWQNPEFGVFGEAVNWKNASGENIAPTGSDRLEFGYAVQPRDIRFDADATIREMYFRGKENGSGSQLYDFDLNGHKVTITELFDVYHPVKNTDSRITFRDGTLEAAQTCKFNLNKDSWPGWGGSLFMTNVAFTYSGAWSIHGKSYPSVICFEGGSRVTLSQVSDQRSGTADFKPKLVVKGKDTVLTVTDGLSVYSTERWEFLDGATITATATALGGWASNSETLFSNVTVSVTSLTLASGGNCTNTYALITGGSKVRTTKSVIINNCSGVGTGNTPPHHTTLEITGDSTLSLDGQYEAGGLELSRWTGYDARLLVGDATVSAYSLTLGAYSHTTGTSSNDYVRIYGPRARIMVSANLSSSIAINNGGTLCYDIPASGFEQVPLESLAGGCATTDNPLDASQQNRLLVNADAFTRKHPNTRVTLIKTVKNSAAAFEKLKMNYIYSGKERYKGEVSYDDTHLYYTSAKMPGLILLLK